MAFRALGRNKMRTALTMLGVIIGVAAVICTVSIGEGATQRIQAAIEDMGANMVWIEAGGVNLNGVRTGNGATKSSPWTTSRRYKIRSLSCRMSRRTWMCARKSFTEIRIGPPRREEFLLIIFS